MTTFFDELSSEIAVRECLKKHYNNLFILSACKQLEKIPNTRFMSIEEPDYGYLLEIANIFAQSTNEEFHNIAQRIAQYVVEFIDNDYYLSLIHI